MKRIVFVLCTLVACLGANLIYSGPECAVFKNAKNQSGRASIQGTEENSPIQGEVLFWETEEGLKIHAHVEGLTPGRHGFHIHEFGDVRNGGKNAGGHYNPEETKHAYVPRDGIENAHAGDLGNIEIDENGEGVFNVIVSGL